jgi:hypothetical protein
MPSSALSRLPFFRIIRALLVTLIALTLGACSMVRLGYDQLPSLTYWWVDSYFDLNDSQSVALRRDLGTLQNWHRTQELPKLASLLAELQTQAPQDTTPQRTCQIMDQLKAQLQAVLTLAEPGLATLARQLTAAQLQHLAHQLDKREQDWREEWVQISPAKLGTRRADHLIERSESFYGRLTTSQRALLTASVLANPYDVRLVEAEMLRRHQDLRQTLQSIAQGGDNAEQAQRRLHPMLLRMVDSPNPGYSTQLEQFTQANCRTFAELHNSASATQRQTLADQLQSYQLDLLALSSAH